MAGRWGEIFYDYIGLIFKINISATVKYFSYIDMKINKTTIYKKIS